MRSLQKIVMTAAVAVLMVSCSDSGTADETTREDGEVVEAGDVGAFRLQVGDCLDAAIEGQVNSLPVVPCGDEHTGEVFHLFDLPDGDFPGDDIISAAAADGCIAAFEGYVGLDFASPRYDISSLNPTQEAWDEIDDREIVCTLSDVAGARLTGSAAGSAE
jgi:hypothetical protein